MEDSFHFIKALGKEVKFSVRANARSFSFLILWFCVQFRRLWRLAFKARGGRPKIEPGHMSILLPFLGIQYILSLIRPT